MPIILLLLCETTFVRSFIWSHSKLCFVLYFPSTRQNDTSAPQRMPRLRLLVVRFLHPSVSVSTSRPLTSKFCSHRTSNPAADDTRIVHAHPMRTFTHYVAARVAGRPHSFLFSLPPFSLTLSLVYLSCLPRTRHKHPLATPCRGASNIGPSPLGFACV